MPHNILSAVDLLIAISEEPAALLRKFCEALGEEAPKLKPSTDGEKHRAIAWWRGTGLPFWFRRLPPRGEHQRHQRHQHQYFDGEMDPADGFHFRGPKEALNLAAGNLRTFMQLAEGVDDETWVYHLKRGDYPRWFRDKIQDQELTALTEQLQRASDVSPQDIRQRMPEMIRNLYVKEI